MGPPPGGGSREERRPGSKSPAGGHPGALRRRRVEGVASGGHLWPPPRRRSWVRRRRGASLWERSRARRERGAGETGRSGGPAARLSLGSRSGRVFARPRRDCRQVFPTGTGPRCPHWPRGRLKARATRSGRARRHLRRRKGGPRAVSGAHWARGARCQPRPDGRARGSAREGVYVGARPAGGHAATEGPAAHASAAGTSGWHAARARARLARRGRRRLPACLAPACMTGVGRSGPSAARLLPGEAVQRGVDDSGLAGSYRRDSFHARRPPTALGPRPEALGSSAPPAPHSLGAPAGLPQSQPPPPLAPSTAGGPGLATPGVPVGHEPPARNARSGPRRVGTGASPHGPGTRGPHALACPGASTL